MTRILGIDYGISKTGLSISDPLKIIARDYDVIFKKTDQEKVQIIDEIIKKEKVELIILGLPLNMDGSHGFQADSVKEFAKLLEKLDVPIKYIDERLTTKMAESMMKEMNASREEIKNKSDARAASLILQEYLDYN